jgi:hypothetical protein
MRSMLGMEVPQDAGRVPEKELTFRNLCTQHGTVSSYCSTLCG